MENNIQTKVNKIGKAGRAVSIILIILLSIGAFGLLVGGVICAALPKDAVQVTIQPNVDVMVDKSLAGEDWAKIDELLTEAQDKVGEEFEGVVLDKTEEGLMVHVSDLDELKNFGIRDALKAICAGLIGIASAIVTVAMFLKLCDAFKTCRSPFDEPVIKRMNIFAWTLIVCAVVGAFAKGAVSAALAGLGKMSFDLSLTPIFTALVVFFLCMVFRYGAQLQQEADETL